MEVVGLAFEKSLYRSCFKLYDLRKLGASFWKLYQKSFGYFGWYCVYYFVTIAESQNIREVLRSRCILCPKNSVC